MGWRPSRNALRAAWEAEDLKTGAGGWVCTAWALVVGDGSVVRQGWSGGKSRKEEEKNKQLFGRDGRRGPLRSSNKSDAVEKSDLYMADLSWAGSVNEWDQDSIAGHPSSLSPDPLAGSTTPLEGQAGTGT